MNKYILVCFFLAMPAVFAVTCANDAVGTVLRSQLTIAETTNSAALGAASTLTYCSGLATLDSCCATATINAFQTKINTVITTIQTAEAARDAAYVTLRTDTTDGLPSIFTDLATIMVKATAAIAKIDTLTSTTALTNLRAQCVLARDWLVSTVSAIRTTKVAFAGYLDNRATCLRKLAETQASVYCVACRVGIDSTYGATQASSMATVPYSDAYKTALQTACYPYLNGAKDQYALWNWFLTAATITDIESKLDNVVSAGADTTTTAANLASALALHVTNTADAKEIPTLTNCATSSGCTYIYTDLMTNGAMISNLKMAAGGTITSGGRLLAEEGNSRMLQTAYDPAANSAGVSTSTVVSNPGNVDTSSAWRQGGVLGCVVALVAMLLF